MPDIEMRFNTDMLVLSAPIDNALSRQGVDVRRDREFLYLIEPETIRDIYRIELMAGAQCLVTNTAGITQARLSHTGLDDRAKDIAKSALAQARALKPQHIFVEIGPTGLPLDATSATSLRQNRDQYARAALLFDEDAFDAYFLNAMTGALDMQCALMGIRKHSTKPIFASLSLNGQGQLGKAGSQAANRSGAEQGSRPAKPAEEAFAMMVEYGANVVGFEWEAPLLQILEKARELRAALPVPLLVQLQTGEPNPKKQPAAGENPYYCADAMIEAATQLRGAGVQFLRASGQATTAYTGALVAASAGFDVML